MAKPNPLKTNLYLKILLFIYNNPKVKPKLIRDYLNKEKNDNEIKEQNFTQKLKKLKDAKLIERKGFNKSSQLEINYSGIIEFIFKEFFNYDVEDLKELNFNDKFLIFLIKDYLNNSRFILDISNQTIYSILEMFIFGFGRAQDLAFRRETYYDGIYKNLDLEVIETFYIFRESALNYYHKKSDNPHTKYISEKMYVINKVISIDKQKKILEDAGAKFS